MSHPAQLIGTGPSEPPGLSSPPKSSSSSEHEDSSSSWSTGWPGPETEDDEPSPGTVRCNICLSFSRIHSFTTLPCGHSFGSKCIANWTQVTKLEDYRVSRMCCPICRAELLYECGCIISENHLRPGVKIEREELSLNCQSYHADIDGDGHSVNDLNRPFTPVTVAEIYSRIENQNVVEADRALLQGRFMNMEEDWLPEDAPKVPQNPPQLEQAEQAERPKQHNFLFSKSLRGPGESENPNQLYELTKRKVAIALDSGCDDIVELCMRRLRADVKVMDRDYPAVNMAITPGMLKTLNKNWEELLFKHEMFKRQHEGFIELNEVGVEFRKSREKKLKKKLRVFWEMYE
ncbi:hypothetical protein F5Y13DRAFT_201706 [Hypoxylon sp. FL1857]|nr:hypothetical protein F5Y13DRAFT_201706 [Hypoxylon sp. FL1857]